MRSVSDRGRSVLALGALSVLAALVGRLAATHPRQALLLFLLPLVAVAATAPAGVLAAAVGSLPYQTEGLPSVGGLVVGPSDLLLLFGLGGVLLAVLGGERIQLNRLGSILPWVTVYFGALLVTWLHIPSNVGFVTIIQRFELVAAALIVGCFLAHRGRIEVALNAYVLVASVLAVVAVAINLTTGATSETFIGVQKNPAGQAIANALILVVFSRRVRGRLPLGLVLTLGLVAAQSRGAILATLLAVAIATIFASSNRRVRALAALPVVVGLAYAAFLALPASQQARLLNTTGEGGDVATELREVYANDAIAEFKSSPVLGTGVGLYLTGKQSDLTRTNDPHNVLLLQAAEGGVVLFAGFAAMSLASAWVLIRRRTHHPLVIPALGVQVSTVLHGVVDIYWVRGTPVLGWVLVGAALYLAAQSREELDSELPEIRQASTRELTSHGAT